MAMRPLRTAMLVVKIVVAAARDLWGRRRERNRQLHSPLAMKLRATGKAGWCQRNSLHGKENWVREELDKAFFCIQATRGNKW